MSTKSHKDLIVEIIGGLLGQDSDHFVQEILSSHIQTKSFKVSKSRFGLKYRKKDGEDLEQTSDLSKQSTKLEEPKQITQPIFTSIKPIKQPKQISVPKLPTPTFAPKAEVPKKIPQTPTENKPKEKLESPVSSPVIVSNINTPREAVIKYNQAVKAGEMPKAEDYQDISKYLQDVMKVLNIGKDNPQYDSISNALYNKVSKDYSKIFKLTPEDALKRYNEFVSQNKLDISKYSSFYDYLDDAFKQLGIPSRGNAKIRDALENKIRKDYEEYRKKEAEEARQYRKDPIDKDKPISDRITSYAKNTEPIFKGLQALEKNLVKLQQEENKLIDQRANLLTKYADDPDADNNPEVIDLCRKWMKSYDARVDFQAQMMTEMHSTIFNHLNIKSNWNTNIDPSFRPFVVSSIKDVAVPFLNKIVAHGDKGPPNKPVRTVNIPEYKEQRAHYTGDICLDKSSSVPTFIHEFGHYLEEHLPGAHEACVEFLNHRVKDEPLTQLNKAFPNSKYQDNEFGRKDNFDKAFGKDYSYYVGKSYPHATEILSMGLELLYKDPVNFAKNDPEYFNFVLGVCDGSLRGGKK